VYIYIHTHTHIYMYLYRIKCLDEKCLYGFAIAVMEAIGSRNSWSGIFRSSD